eukprot:1469843-Prymnesium_polylepis.1
MLPPPAVLPPPASLLAPAETAPAETAPSGKRVALAPETAPPPPADGACGAVSYTHLRAHETLMNL